MEKLKVALLEDSKSLLKDLKETLEETGLVEVVAFATGSEDFFERIKGKNPDALFLDIDLSGDSMTGLEIAYKLQLPVLFVSSHNGTNIKDIEKLEREHDVIVSHYTKPLVRNDFIKTTTRFINEVKKHQERQYIYLDFAGTKRNKIQVDSIACLCAEKESGAESGNKQIFFTNRKPEVLVDFSFVKMEEKGFDKNRFITIHKSYRVNVDNILSYKDSHEIEVEIVNEHGRTEKKFLRVSENYRKTIQMLKKA